MAIAQGQFTIIDYNDITTSNTAPASPPTGTFWVDTSVTPNLLKRWSGTAWVVVNDYSGAIAAATTAEALVTKINDGTETIKANKIWLDEEEQVLTTKFSKLTLDLGGLNETTISNLTEIRESISGVESDYTKIRKDHSGLTETVSKLSAKVVEDAEGIKKQYDEVVSTLDKNTGEIKTLVAKTMSISEGANGLIISQEGNAFSSKFTNTALEFFDGDTAVAHISNKEMRITDAVILHSLTLAQWTEGYFMWECTDTHLNFKWGE